jgi:Flp pilus assembly protein TadD
LLGRLDEAEASYTQAIALKPDYAEPHNHLGITLQKLGRLDEAEASYKKAIAFKPDLADAHYNLGNTLKELGRLDEAEASLMKAITLKPDFVELHYNLGITRQKLGKLDEAEASYTKALALKPDYAEAHSNLGIALQKLGKLDEAEVSYTKAITLKPDYAEAHSNLGITLKELGRLDEAEASCRQAIKLNSDLSEAHNNLGVTLKKLGRLNEAEVSYTQAMALKPDFAEAIQNKWLLLFEKNEFEAALSHSDAHILKKSRASDLITLYALGRTEEIYNRIEIQSKIDGENIYIAAFAAFISEVEKKATANKFCPEPINFVHISNLASHIQDSSDYIAGLIKELKKMETTWEPSGKATVSGFQTLLGKNLFESPSIKMSQLKTIIINEIESYSLKHHSESCSYIQKLPSGNNLFGWHVILKHQGHQTAHMHPGGWLSGVIYLKVVPSLGKNEGAIEFSLNGENYSNINSSNLIHRPKIGDIVFFPSSLHHRTIPFTTNSDRIIVSFDLQPESAKH